MDWLEMSCEDPQQAAFATAAGSHDTDHFAAPDRQGDPFHRRRGAAEAVADIPQLQLPDDIPFFFDDAVAKPATQILPFAQTDQGSLFEDRTIPFFHVKTAYRDVAGSLQDFQIASPGFIVTPEVQEDFAAQAG